MIQVAIVDDHVLVREGLTTVFERTEDIRVHAEFPDGATLLSTVDVLETTDVIIMDITMPAADGMDTLNRLRATHPDHPPVIFLTMHPEHSYAVAAIRSGARGYVTKDADDQILTDAVRSVVSGGLYLSHTGTELLLSDDTDPSRENAGTAPASPTELSSQERIVFTSLCEGYTIKEIGYEMGVSDKTVSTYKARIMTKLNVTSLVELVRIGMEYGLVR